MHHVITSIREPGSTWMADKNPGVVFVPPRGPAGGGSSTAASSDTFPGK